MPALEDWKATFRMIELGFFRQSLEDWPHVFDAKLEDLDRNYSDRHEGHVLILNDRLRLFPPLRENHFNGSIEVRRLQRDLVEPRIRGSALVMNSDLGAFPSGAGGNGEDE